MLWNTCYLDVAVARFRAGGHDIEDEDAARISPHLPAQVRSFRDPDAAGDA